MHFKGRKRASCSVYCMWGAMRQRREPSKWYRKHWVLQNGRKPIWRLVAPRWLRVLRFDMQSRDACSLGYHFFCSTAAVNVFAFIKILTLTYLYRTLSQKGSSKFADLPQTNTNNGHILHIYASTNKGSYASRCFYMLPLGSMFKDGKAEGPCSTCPTGI